MLFHFDTPALDRKIIIRSALILLSLLAVTVAIDRIASFGQTIRLFMYLIPFIFHVLISIFVKNKASWLIGAIGCTIISMVLLVVISLLVL